MNQYNRIPSHYQWENFILTKLSQYCKLQFSHIDLSQLIHDLSIDVLTVDLDWAEQNNTGWFQFCDDVKTKRNNRKEE